MNPTVFLRNLLLIAPILCLPMISAAQKPPPDPTIAALQKQIHIVQGPTTLKEIARMLSEQTGLRIEATDYLQARRLSSVHLDHLSVTAALDAIAELNDWTWIEPEPNHILIQRPRPLQPQQNAEIPAALRAMLPRDIQRFFGLGATMSDIPPITEERLQGMLTIMRRHSKLRPNEELDMRVVQRIAGLVDKHRQALFQSLEPGIEEGKTISWAQLNAAQRRDLQIALAFGPLQLCVAHAIDLYRGDLDAYEIDPAVATIVLHQGDGMEIGSRVNGVYAAFGTAIPGLRSTAQPRIPPAQLNPP